MKTRRELLKYLGIGAVVAPVVVAEASKPESVTQQLSADCIRAGQLQVSESLNIAHSPNIQAVPMTVNDGKQFIKISANWDQGCAAEIVIDKHDGSGVMYSAGRSQYSPGEFFAAGSDTRQHWTIYLCSVDHEGRCAEIIPGITPSASVQVGPPIYTVYNEDGSVKGWIGDDQGMWLKHIHIGGMSPATAKLTAG